MKLRALYVYQTTEFAIETGEIEPLLLASGAPTGVAIRRQDKLAPGMYRVAGTTQCRALASTGFEFQDLASSTDLSGKGGGGLPDPPRLALALLQQPGETTDDTKARLLATLEGQGEAYAV